MINKKIAIITLALILSTGFAAGFAGTVSFTLDSGAFDSLPEPRLRYPITETVVLTGQDPLEFKWWNDVVGIRGFILKIYKGYNMYGVNLIHKEDLSAQDSSVKVNSGLFEDGQVYTWSLLRVSFSGYKSEKSFQSFKVIRK